MVPAGPLPLRVFEPRYLDMVSRCLREQSPFGVLLVLAFAAGYLQLSWGLKRQKIGDDPTEPRYIETEPGVWVLARRGVRPDLSVISREFVAPYDVRL